jgi:hypothetical protein
VVWGLGFKFWGLGFLRQLEGVVACLGVVALGLLVRVQGQSLRFGIWRLGLGVEGFCASWRGSLPVAGYWFRVWGLGLRNKGQGKLERVFCAS